MEVEYLLTRAAEKKPKVAVMTRRLERLERRSLAGPSSGETRWRWSSVLEIVTSEVRDDSQDWELNIIKPDQWQNGVTVMFVSKLIFPSLLTYKSQNNVDCHDRKSDSESGWCFTVTHVVSGN